MIELEGDLLTWVVPAVLVLASLLLRPIFAAALKRLAGMLKSESLRSVAAGISWLLVPLTLYWAAGIAPISKKWATGIQDFASVASIVILMGALRTFLLHMIEWSMRRAPRTVALTEGFIPLIRNLVTLLTFLLGAVLVLKQFGYDVWSLLTALGVGSLAIGLAAKDTLSHMISGFVLIIDRNLHPGDRISFAGATGTVEVIGLRSTRMTTPDGSTWVVPNSELVNTKILNFSLRHGSTRISTVVRVPQQVQMEKIRELGREVLRAVPDADRSREFESVVQSLAEGFQSVELAFWVNTESPEAQARALSGFLEEFLLQARGRQIPLMGAPAVPA